MVSVHHVITCHAPSQRVVSTHYIQDISHCCSDIEDGRVFAYMTKEKETNHSYCHVFMVQSKVRDHSQYTSHSRGEGPTTPLSVLMISLLYRTLLMRSY